VGTAVSTELDAPIANTLEPERIFAMEDCPVFGAPISSRRISSVAGGTELSEAIQTLSQTTHNWNSSFRESSLIGISNGPNRFDAGNIIRKKSSVISKKQSTG
jgi:hypothetical protein